MAFGPRYAVKFRRRREDKTNYRKRPQLLKSGMPRLVIRKSTNYIQMQIIAYEPKGDRTLVATTSAKLKDFGWKHGYKSIPAAYLTGLMLAKLAKEAKVPKANSDLGKCSLTKGTKLLAAIKGAADGGLEIAYDGKKMPDETRIAGKHIADYRKIDITKDFEAVKAKLVK